jgi:two-component system LytT family response regulator
LLAPKTDYRIVAECGNGREAVAMIEREKPDVVFLDIRMPGMSGVEVATEVLERDRPPLLVFVTAYDEFAVHAFDLSAVDYLVKPVDFDRFDRALARIEARLGGGAPRPMVDDLRLVLDELRAGPGRVKRFLVRGPRGSYFVRTEDIETATASGNYVVLVTGGRQHMIRETMQSLETKIDPTQFIRIHRSIIVNVDQIARIESLGHSEYRVVMKSGAHHQSSRSYSSRFRDLVG